MLGLLDLLSTLGFACAGASIASRNRMALSGVLLSAILASTGGGTARDILLGSGTLFWIESPAYLLAALLSVPATLSMGRAVRVPATVRRAIVSAGTSVFILVGALAALDAGCGWSIALAMGILTGVGGGIIRQLVCERSLDADIRKNLCATAAAALSCVGLMILEASLPCSIVLAGSIHFLAARPDASGTGDGSGARVTRRGGQGVRGVDPADSRGEAPVPIG